MEAKLTHLPGHIDTFYRFVEVAEDLEEFRSSFYLSVAITEI